MSVVIESTIPQAVAKLLSLEGIMPEVEQAILVKTAEKARVLLGDELRRRTPVGKTGGPHLRDSAVGEIAYGPGSAEVIERQTKTIPIQGQNVPLAKVLRTGRRGFRLEPPYPNKKALFWPGAPHPVMSANVGPAAPNPYAAEAATAAMPIVVAVAQRIASDTMQAGVREALR